MFLVSYNVAQLPWPYNSLGHLDDRMKAVCQALLDDASLSVVCFQELFSSSARKIVRNMLGLRFPYMCLDDSVGKYGVGVNSGLGIVSRLPFVEHSLREYTQRRNVEYFAKKGLMGVRIPILGIGNLFVYTTHLQAGGNQAPLSWFNSTPADVIKHLQIRQACDWMQDDANSDTTAVVLFCGDFNLSPDEGPLATIHSSGFVLARDSFDSLSSPSLYSNSSGKRVDYFFVLRTPISIEVKSIITGDMANSDHLPVIARVSEIH